ncbi:MAG: tetratricopeptide repeat protein [Thermosynechococcaceae cyanobacterium]
MRISRYTPSLSDPKDLEAIFVQRHKLAGQLVEVIRESALTASKHYTLLIGPRGIGKTHLVSLLYHRVAQQPDLQDRLVIAWLREEEWGLGSFFDLVLRILNALQQEYKDDDLSAAICGLYDLAPQEAEAVALSALIAFIGERTLLLFIENLDEVFRGLDDIGQKQLRSFLQEQGCCTIVATSQSLFNGVKLQTSPFYGFFRIRYLKDFSVDEAVAFLVKIAQLEADSELVRLLRSPRGRSRVQAVHHLAGGNPRIYVIFSEFLTRESLDELIQPFINMLDDLTPYYQARMMYLSPQQRKIIEVLSRRRHPMPVKDIAQQCFVTHQTVSSQLKDLRDKGYVVADSVGRESFYELREPLMRICLSVKETRGEPVRLIVDFLRSWYPRQELQLMQDYFFDALESDEGQSCKTLENRKSTQEVRLSDYIKLALDDSEEEQDPRIAACFQELIQQYEEQDFDTSLSLAQKLVQLRGIAEDFFAQGLILNTLGRHEEAISSYEQVIKFKPDYHKAFFYRGIDLSILGRYDEAISSYDEAIQFKPDDYEAFYNRGNILNDLRRYDEAISSYDKAIQFKPDLHEAFHNRGVALGCLGRDEEAIKSCDQALELKPDFDLSWENKGITLEYAERYEEAIASFDKALEINPNRPDVELSRAEAIFSLSPNTEAYTALEDALKQLTESYKTGDWKADIMLLSLFKRTQDLQQWQSHIQKLLSLFEQYQFLNALSVGLIKNCSALLSEMVSQAAAQAWVDIWEVEAGKHEEFKISLRLLETTVHYKQKPDDPRVFLELPTEERAILKQALSLEQ